MRGKQGCPLSSTLFGLCINILELVNKNAREDGLDAPKLMQQVILLFSSDFDGNTSFSLWSKSVGRHYPS